MIPPDVNSVAVLVRCAVADTAARDAFVLAARDATTEFVALRAVRDEVAVRAARDVVAVRARVDALRAVRDEIAVRAARVAVAARVGVDALRAVIVLVRLLVAVRATLADVSRADAATVRLSFRDVLRSVVWRALEARPASRTCVIFARGELDVVLAARASTTFVSALFTDVTEASSVSASGVRGKFWIGTATASRDTTFCAARQKSGVMSNAIIKIKPTYFRIIRIVFSLARHLYEFILEKNAPYGKRYFIHTPNHYRTCNCQYERL